MIYIYKFIYIYIYIYHVQIDAMNPVSPIPNFNPGCNIVLPICHTSNAWIGDGPQPPGYVVPNYQVGARCC